MLGRGGGRKRRFCIMENEFSSFKSFSAYRRALRRTPERLWHRAGMTTSPEAELRDGKGRSEEALRRRLEWYEVVGMGVGGMVGAGIFVTTGSVARNYAGPGVIISYLVAGITALLSAICYTEFAVEMPVAGGAFSYLKVTLGEFAAFFTGANLIMEYVVSNAAVARTFLSYFVTIFETENANSWRLKVSEFGDGFDHLDVVALALVLLVTLSLCYSTKQSAVFNLVVTIVHLMSIVFIIIVGFAKGSWVNLHEPRDTSQRGGFMPYGIPGVVNGAAIVYFSYIGYDAASTMAEEVINPAFTMPMGVSGSVVIVTILYCLTAAAICLLQPYDQIDPNAPFIKAFQKMKGWEWAQRVVGGGASLGILTSIIVAMFGQARYLCVIGRSHVVPEWFARVNPRTGTPVNATVFLGLCTAAISFFTDIEILLQIVSIGTLFVFYMVANALICHIHVKPGQKNLSAFYFLVLLSASALCFSLVWTFHPGYKETWILFGGFIAVMSTALLYTLLTTRKSPVLTLIASASIFLNIFLMASIDGTAYRRFVIWSIVAVAYYVLYGVHATHDAAEGTGDVIAFIKLDDFGSDRQNLEENGIRSPHDAAEGSGDVTAFIKLDDFGLDKQNMKENGVESSSEAL